MPPARWPRPHRTVAQQLLGPLKELLDENSNLRVIQSVDLLSKLNVSFASESVSLVVCLF